MFILSNATFILARSSEPPSPIFFLLFPLFWMGISLLVSSLLGIFRLYREYPADENDLIEDSFWWVQVEFGSWRGHAPMNLRLGRKALHIKEVFPFQPLFWLGPASIPWTEITQTKRIGESWWQRWSAAEFLIGSFERKIRLRGRSGRAVQAKMDGMQGRMPTSIVPH